MPSSSSKRSGSSSRGCGGRPSSGRCASASAAFGHAAGSPPASRTASRTRWRRALGASRPAAPAAGTRPAAARGAWRARGARSARSQASRVVLERDRAHALGQPQQPRDVAGEHAPRAAGAASAHSARRAAGRPARRPLLGVAPRRARSPAPPRAASPGRTGPASAVPESDHLGQPVAVRHPRLTQPTQRTHATRRPRHAPRATRADDLRLEHRGAPRQRSLAGRQRARATRASKSSRESRPLSSVPAVRAAPAPPAPPDGRRALARARLSSNRLVLHDRSRWTPTPPVPQLETSQISETASRSDQRERRRRRRPEGMRQISTSTRTPRRGDLRLDRGSPATLVRGQPRADAPAARAGARSGTPLRAADRRPGSAPRRARAPRARSRRRHPRARRRATASSPRRRRRRAQQHDLRAPPQPVAVALGLVRDQAGGLQVIQPALHAAPMRAHEPRPLGAIARDRTPADHRRQPRHQLRDRRREARRALRVPEPEQVALDRVRARLQPIITRRRAAARSRRARPSSAHDHQPARLSRQRLDRRPIPTTRRPSSTRRKVRSSGTANARRRHGSTTALRTRADARGTAGPAVRSRDAGRSRRTTNPTPREGVGDPSGSAATVREYVHMWALTRQVALSGRKAADEDRAGYPVFFVLRAESRRPAEPPAQRGVRSAADRRAVACAVDGVRRRRESRRGDGALRTAARGARPSPFRHLFTRERCESAAERCGSLPGPGRRESPAIAARCGPVRSGSDGTRTRDLRRDRPAL